MIRHTPRLPGKNVNISKESPVREFFVLISGILAFIVGSYFVLGFAVDLIVPRISTETEQALASHLLKHFGKTENAQDKKTQALQSLADDLQKKCANLPYRFHVRIADEDTVNAVALPGGHIVVFRGLLEKTASENELAFVLFHEMGHFAHRDHLRGLGRGLVFALISSFLLGPDNDISALLLQSLHVSEMKFSREQESRADEFALNMLHCAYGDVNGAALFFSRLAEEETSSGFVGKYYLSHPESKERISHIETYGSLHGFPASAALRPLPDVLRFRVEPASSSATPEHSKK
ncbi:MAG: M48 family metallopeptidase [Desulfobacterales bacterium]